MKKILYKKTPEHCRAISEARKLAKLYGAIPQTSENKKLHSVWNEMRRRCNNPNHWAYRWYGARGIIVCDEWRFFRGFLHDMGSTYKLGLWIERIDNNKGYCKNNCKWDTPENQHRNKRGLRLLVHEGKIQTLSDWSREKNIKITTICMRLNRYGWSVARSLNG